MAVPRARRALAWLVLSGALSFAVSPAAGSQAAPAPGVQGIARLYPTPEALGSFLAREITFGEDQELFGCADYWQSPQELLQRRRGDCEDYALLAQAVLRRQGREALVLSLYGPGYAHTVCLFREGSSYHILNQDRVIRCGASSLEEAAAFLYPRWAWGAVARRFGGRGQAIRRIHNPVAF